MTFSKLEEEELEDLNDNCNLNANAAAKNDTGTGNFVDFASLGNRSVSDGDGLDLDNPESIWQSRSSRAGSDGWGSTDDCGSGQRDSAGTTRFSKERCRGSVGNCDSLRNNSSVRLSGGNCLRDDHRLGLVEGGNVGNNSGDATNVDSLSHVEDLNRETGDLRRQSRLDLSSGGSGDRSNVLGSNGGHFDIDSSVDSRGDDNVVRKSGRNDRNGDSEISIDSDRCGLRNDLNNRRTSGLNQSLGSLRCSDDGIVSLGDNDIFVLPIYNIHCFSDRADHLASFPTIGIVVCPYSRGRKVCSDCHELAGCHRECSRGHWSAVGGQ